MRGLEGKKPGTIKIMKMKEDSYAVVELVCSECGTSETKNMEWCEPFVEGEGINKKFNVSCSSCGFSTTVLKLKKEAKKKK